MSQFYATSDDDDEPVVYRFESADKRDEWLAQAGGRHPVTKSELRKSHVRESDFIFREPTDADWRKHAYADMSRRQEAKTTQQVNDKAIREAQREANSQSAQPKPKPQPREHIWWRKGK